MFFNVVNMSTSLNVADGFKGKDLADEFVHLHNKKAVFVRFLSRQVI